MSSDNLLDSILSRGGTALRLRPESTFVKVEGRASQTQRERQRNVKCDYCKQPMSYCFYINDAHWIKVVGEEKFDKNVGHVCAHCALERLGGLSWYIIWNEPTENIRRQQSETGEAAHV